VGGERGREGGVVPGKGSGAVCGSWYRVHVSPRPVPLGGRRPEEMMGHASYLHALCILGLVRTVAVAVAGRVRLSLLRLVASMWVARDAGWWRRQAALIMSLAGLGAINVRKKKASEGVSGSSSSGEGSKAWQ
jgi:hypothetical protein